MTFALSIATLFLIVATLLPVSRHPHWIVRGMDFPRLQLATLAAVLAVMILLLLDLRRPSTWALCGGAIFCLTWHLWWILPYTRLWRKEVETATDDSPERRISIMTANVLTPNRDSERLIALVRRHEPDILVTLESDQWWQDRLDVLESEMPYAMKCPLDNLYGMHVYSRLPLAEAETSFLVEDDIPSMHALLTLRSDDEVRLHFLHPAPPSPTENPESEERDAELIIVARSVGETDKPIIVTGDLNDVAWSRTTRLFRKLSGLLDPRVGRGMFNTFHAKIPVLRWPLDHLFHSDHFTVVAIERLPSIGSDHFALLTRLSFSPGEGADQKGLEADADDEEFADDVSEEQNVDESDVPRPGE